MILGVTSNGNWLSSFVSSRNNSDNIFIYLKALMRWIVFDLHFQTKDIVLMMDNSSIHKTKEITKFLNKTGWIVTFIPPYTPSFAPVELIFNIFKKSLWKQNKNISVDLWRAEGERTIIKALNVIDKNHIKDSFIHWFREINQTILSFMKHIRQSMAQSYWIF